MLSTLLNALLFNGISVLWVCEHGACHSLGERIGTETGCDGCRRVQRTVKNTAHNT